MQITILRLQTCITLLTGLILCCEFMPSKAAVYARQRAEVCSKLTVRREWRLLELDERASWIASVKCMANMRHERLSYTVQGALIIGEHSLYDDFAYAHAAMESTAHINPYFLPWHRWFLYLFDISLRESCGYSGPTPYWDWSLDVADLVSAPVFNSDPVYGLGNGGDCTTSSDCVVQDGALSPFAPDPQFVLSFPVPHSLRRNLSLYTGELGPNERPQNATLSLANIEHVIQNTTGDFFRFQDAMTHMHNHVHNFVGGDLAGVCSSKVPDEDCTSTTSNDPLFWLHHGQLDRLWSKWQHLDSNNFQDFAGFPLGSHNLSNPRFDLNATVHHKMMFDRLSSPVSVEEVFNHTAPPFCYMYPVELI